MHGKKKKNIYIYIYIYIILTRMLHDIHPSFSFLENVVINIIIIMRITAIKTDKRDKKNHHRMSPCCSREKPYCDE